MAKGWEKAADKREAMQQSQEQGDQLAEADRG